MRRADDIDNRLDDSTSEATLTGLAHIDDPGVLSTTGTRDIGNERLFDTRIAGPRHLDCTQCMAQYLSLTAPKPGSASLAAAGLLGASLAHRRQPWPIRLR